MLEPHEEIADATSDIANAVLETLRSTNEADSNLEAANIVDALFFVGRRISSELKYLGGGDDKRGSIELLADAVKGSGESIAMAISELADAVREMKK